MRSVAVLHVLGLLLIPMQASAACSFLPPVGGGDPIVKKKVERPKGLLGKAVFVDHLALNCACVGGNSRTPLGVVSFAENLIMGLMGLAMLIQPVMALASGGAL
ncbi:glutaredoxin family protein [Synechococcus sp. PROS-U-1]|nr:glutaredoxin family protein [Synechococcus sp. PROS-U-1]